MTKKIINPPSKDDIKTIVIACKGATTLSIHNLKEFQGELKTLLDEDYERLKKEIVELGFSFTFQVWQNEGNNWIMDGHQRMRVLLKMETEGWVVPDVPVSLVYADTYQQAKRKCLGAASNYGRVTNDGLLQYIQDMDYSPKALQESYRFGDLDVNNFVDSNFDDHFKTVMVSAHERTSANEILPPSIDDFENTEKKTKFYTCPHCQNEFKESQAMLRVE